MADNINMSLSKFLGPLPISQESMTEVSNDARNALLIVDMLTGFCESGPLKSPHNDALKHPIAHLAANFSGPILSIQDAHHDNDIEFKAFPPHCITGSKEAELVEPIKSKTSTHHRFQVLEKQTLSPFFGAHGFENWLSNLLNEGIMNIYITGNCTDLCVYQTAMGVKLWLSEEKTVTSVKVITNMVDTYDLPAERAPEGVLPHPRDLFNRVFLHHLALNGVELVNVE